jgi:hypothetical protein
MEIKVPQALLERVKALCKKRDIDPNDFILDAITEKLESAHKERRKRKRI